MSLFWLNLNKKESFNIESGKVASKETALFLLHVTDIGNRAREEFIEECKNNPKIFEERVKKQNMHSFDTEGDSFKLSNKNKITEVKTERHLFWNILFTTLQRKIDMGEMLNFPLIPVPLFQAHIDGWIQKTTRILLLKELKIRVIFEASSNIDAFVIDAIFFLLLLKELPETFGLLAISKFQKLQNVWSNWAKQKRPSNFQDAFYNDYYKKALVKFIFSIWSEQKYETMLQK